jgi:uncharacterized protein (TIGR02466 family)
MNLTELFETPIIFREIHQFDLLNTTLTAMLLARRSSDRGWSSDRRMLEWGGAGAETLLQHIRSLANKYSQYVGANRQRRYAWKAEMWAEIPSIGQFVPALCHPGAFWKAIYCVNDGYAGSLDRDLGGELELEDPRMPTVLMEGPNLRFRHHPQAPIASTEVALRPAAGRLLLFPAWLRHSVRPFNGIQDRIFISTLLTPTLESE